jgi:succinyl-diaminopimelate desuccinylase
VSALADLSAEFYGASIGVAMDSGELGKVTHSCSVVRAEGDRLTFTCDVRYPAAAEPEKLLETIRPLVEKKGFAFELTEISKPNYIPPDDPAVQALCAIANEQIGYQRPPAVMGGGTYARKIPRAVGYGPSRPDLKKPFPEGNGWAHQANEAVRIKNLTDLIRVYVPALITLDSSKE